jgi:NAD+ synthase
MADRFRLTLAQLNPWWAISRATPPGARGLGRGARGGRRSGGLPEMFITGYNTQDLVMKPAFHEAAMRGSERWRRPAPMARRLPSAGRAPRGQALQRLFHPARRR